MNPINLADTAAALNACAAVLKTWPLVTYATIHHTGIQHIALTADAIPMLEAAGAVWDEWGDGSRPGLQMRCLTVDVDGVTFVVYDERPAVS